MSMDVYDLDGADGCFNCCCRPCFSWCVSCRFMNAVLVAYAVAGVDDADYV